MSRRISYVLPAPDAPLPLLSLPALTEPRLGRTSPLLLQRSAGQPTKSSRRNISSLKDSTLNSDGSSHPRHSLGVAAIALDTSTQLAGQSTPQGILYTGGRDGLVAGWELGLPMTKRRRPRWNETSRPGERVKWERLELGESGVSSTGGWGDENEDGDVDEIDSDLDQEDESYDGNSSDGHADQTLFDDSGGNQKVSSGRGTSSRRRELEYTERWQLDKDALESRPVNRLPEIQSDGTIQLIIHVLLLPSLSLKRQHSGSPYRRIRTGSMTYFYAIRIRLSSHARLTVQFEHGPPMTRKRVPRQT